MSATAPTPTLPALPAPFAWRAGEIALDLPDGHVRFTTRLGGVSTGPYASLNLGRGTEDDPAAVAENRRRVAARAGVARLLQGHQVHGTAVSVEGGAGDADGQVTARPGHAPIVLVADCLPVALLAPGAVAMVHAGWRGLAGGILAEGVRAVRHVARDGGARVSAAIGPAAGGCCYEVGDEVRAAFGTTTRTLDLAAIAAGQLRAAGVGGVHVTGLCTLCAPDGLLFSHRRDGGVTGRQAGLAWWS